MHSLRVGLGTLLVVVLCVGNSSPGVEPPRKGDPPTVARAVDRLLDDHWKAASLTPAAGADDLNLYRRLMLDLAGRVPTADEVLAFAATPATGRYERTVQALMDGPEFANYFATVLDESIQGRLAGNEAFIGYLRRALRENKPWDAIFRDVLLGPWDAEPQRSASLFLERRGKDLDVLTVDVGRAFFGVDISCARCHNHPLVPDWKQDHYYGLAAFLNRTESTRGKISEKTEGEVQFATRRGEQRTARMMFLTGRIVEEPKKAEKPAPSAPRYSRREQLVRVALEEQQIFARALVNRVWAHFFGRGLVEPVDQIHSGNPAAVPGLLDHLATEFIAGGYNLKRLVTALVLTRAYRLDSRWPRETALPAPEQFAVARLRPLSPRQLAISLLLVLGEDSRERPAERVEVLEKSALGLQAALDPRTADFQSSTREALFVTNSEAIAKLVANQGNNLSARLASIPDLRVLLDTAFRAVLSRPPTVDEVARLTKWFAAQGDDRRATCESLVWALIASAEFRFNH